MTVAIKHAEALREILARIPREEREKTVARGGFPLQPDTGDHTCKDGLCVWAALLRDYDEKIWTRDLAGNGMPGAIEISEVLLHNALLGEASDRYLLNQDYERAVEELINLNDTGRLSDPETVRAVLIDLVEKPA